MTPTSGSGRADRSAKAAGAIAVAQLSRLLQDPKNRALVMENGQALFQVVQRHWEDRTRNAHGDEAERRRSRMRVVPVRRLGAQRLTDRVDRLGDALDNLRAKDPDLAEAFGDVRAQVAEVERRIPVAEAMSGRPRRQMLRALRRRIDGLEGALRDALLPAAEDDAGT